MIVRIVKMRFQEDKIDSFLSNFELNKDKIRGFEGNLFLELYQDRTDPRIFFTYSYWENDEALHLYRNSYVFAKIWSETKCFFSEKAQAWSVDKLVSLK